MTTFVTHPDGSLRDQSECARSIAYNGDRFWDAQDYASDHPIALGLAKMTAQQFAYLFARNTSRSPEQFAVASMYDHSTLATIKPMAAEALPYIPLDNLALLIRTDRFAISPSAGAAMTLDLVLLRNALASSGRIASRSVRVSSGRIASRSVRVWSAIMLALVILSLWAA